MRSHANELINCDEIGDKDDIEELSWARNCGVPIITTIHASNFEELISRKAGKALLDTGAFSYAIFLKGRNAPGQVEEVISLDDYKATGSLSNNSLRRNAWAMAGR